MQFIFILSEEFLLEVKPFLQYNQEPVRLVFKQKLVTATVQLLKSST